MIKGVIIAFICFLMFLLHVVFEHRFNVKRHFHVMSAAFFIGTLLYAFFFAATPEEPIQIFIATFIPLPLFAIINGAFIFLFLCFVYLYLLQMTERSAAVRIAVEIEKAPKKQLTLEQIQRIYGIDDKVFNGLEDMRVLGRLKKEGEQYVLTPKGKIHLRVFKLLRDYLRLARN